MSSAAVVIKINVDTSAAIVIKINVDTRLDLYCFSSIIRLAPV